MKSHAELRLCQGCRLTTAAPDRCPRCDTPLSKRVRNSVQTSAALLLTAFCFLFPANFLPITQTINQGVNTYDTIFSGITYLFDAGMAGIAIIVLVASIIVPITKIFGLAVILLTIKLDLPLSRRQLTTAFHVIEFIGRWSMLDLFVISIMVSLINMGQLLYAIPAPAATYFALVILFTQFAAQRLDTRLLWDLEKENDEL
ncbi:paraquat-inducible protein A [Ferrimonas lipolytica]|uniref:Paraquat-inducible membrane protein A n=1 Tax=Ferrimonas lipolytica TaxID=2724191 RepID=A0A6H1UFH9_9GAMM|nr:paraquat-inducible protein A [Ferrimonas lipolytica]QIZ76552.1 paraquat-inducible membrane protein A [Ferrimonas lipolytica]